MEELKLALKLIKEKAKEEYGEDAPLEDGDSLVGVFNDATVIVSNENNAIDVNVIVGEPYIFDINLFKGEDINNV